MRLLNWKAIVASALLAGVGVVWIPKAMDSLGQPEVPSGPIEEPIMIDPATGLPLEMPVLGSASAEALPAAETGAETEQVTTNDTATAAPELVSTNQLLELAARMRSDREARISRNHSAATPATGLEVLPVRPEARVEEVLSKYTLTATLRSGDKQLAIIQGQPVELNESFGEDGLVLRAVGWSSVGVEYQSQRYELHLPGFRAQAASEGSSGQQPVPGPVPSMP
jgi:hypothetical protein